MSFHRWLAGLGLLAAFLAWMDVAAAQEAGEVVIGAPENWQVWHQPPATGIMSELIGFHEMLIWIISGISLLVLVLLLYVILRFNARANPTPSRTSHNTVLEVAWTVVPVLILVVIAIPSFRLLYDLEVAGDEEADLTVKVIGRQWYWDYEYPDLGIAITSYMVPDEEIAEGQHRILDVDNPVILPTNTGIRFLITGGDVIHSWGIPSLGFTKDAVPGRINEIVLTIERPGIYYGQCRELCGTGHAFMPAVVKAVPPEYFERWAKRAAAAQGNPIPGALPTQLAKASGATEEPQQ